MNSLLFTRNPFLTIGVELELQLVSLNHFNLSAEATDLIRRLSGTCHEDEVKPEITQAMIELNTSVHQNYPSLLKELKEINLKVSTVARKANVGICGGGAHPFQKWSEQRIYPTERFTAVSEQYGYLAKQFTVFGQHIHVGVPSGDDAIYLCHAMALYIPHFIALSASSPFYQGVDTAFDSARLAAISAFPLSGTPPWLHSWEEFQQYFTRMRNLGIVQNMKDFYWDIRPKPEYGTIELRVCDTPLTVGRAALLAAYMQMLVRFLLEERPPLSRDVYLSYTVNRFQACRFGFQGQKIDPIQGKSTTIGDDIIQTLGKLELHAKALNSTRALLALRKLTLDSENDAYWLRQQLNRFKYLPDVVQAQVEIWNKAY